MDSRVAELHQRAAQRSDVIALAGGLPADDLLPRTAVAAIAADVSRAPATLQYGWPEGLASLREWIAARLGARGLSVDPDRVVVTSGAQQALTLVAGALHRGAQIAVGDAAYPSAIAAFARRGLDVVTDDRDAAARYVVPGVANPQGVELVDPVAVLACTAQLVVDEAYVELRFDGHVPAPLAIAAPDRVWHIGSVSKTLCPGLRIGWLVPPEAQLAEVRAAKQAADLQTSTLSQAVLIGLLEVIDYDAVLRRARRLYATRADALTSALHRHAPHLRFRPPEGGFSIWIETDGPGDDVELLAAALDAGVTFDPGSMFRPDGTGGPIAFRLSFSHAPIAALEEGVRRLARVLGSSRWAA